MTAVGIVVARGIGGVGQGRMQMRTWFFDVWRIDWKRLGGGKEGNGEGAVLVVWGGGDVLSECGMGIRFWVCG